MHTWILNHTYNHTYTHIHTHTHTCLAILTMRWYQYCTSDGLFAVPCFLSIFSVETKVLTPQSHITWKHLVLMHQGLNPTHVELPEDVLLSKRFFIFLFSKMLAFSSLAILNLILTSSDKVFFYFHNLTVMLNLSKYVFWIVNLWFHLQEFFKKEWIMKLQNIINQITYWLFISTNQKESKCNMFGEE